jgi:hypothetical protein
MVDTSSIDERLRLLSRIAYPVWLEQLDLVRRLDTTAIQQDLARIVTSLPRVTVLEDMRRLLPTEEQTASLLASIEKGLPSYDALRDLHVANVDGMLEAFEIAENAVTAMVRSSVAESGRVDWAITLAQPRALQELLGALPGEGLRDSLLAEAMLSRFDLSELASRLSLDRVHPREFAAAHVGILSAYAALSHAPSWLNNRGEQPDWMADYPSRALLLHADATEQISVAEPSEDLAIERAEHIVMVIHSEDRTLPELLGEIDPDLPPLLDGAEDAIARRDADWVRHFSISGRELTTHVLHTLAPDDEIREWTADPEYYHDGHPTRRARTDFILGRLESADMSAYVDAVFRALLATHDLLQKGAHALSAEDLEALAPTLLGQLKVSLAVLIRVSRLIR